MSIERRQIVHLKSETSKRGLASEVGGGREEKAADLSGMLRAEAGSSL